MNEQRDPSDVRVEEQPTRLSTADMAGAAEHTPTNGAGQPVEHGHASSGLSADQQEARATPLLPEDEGEQYRSRWSDMQASFVDEPRQAVGEADHLVAEVIQRVAQVFADERAKLEGAWSQGDEVDTEDLRQALRRYRSFFERLLNA